METDGGCGDKVVWEDWGGVWETVAFWSGGGSPGFANGAEAEEIGGGVEVGGD